MEALSFDSGIRTYSVNDACEISFNPTSEEFVNRFLNMMDALKAITTVTDAETEAVKRDNRKSLEYMRLRDQKIKAEIDNLFGSGVSDSIFPYGPTAMADGVPVWLNFCLMIMDLVDEKTGNMEALARPRLQKYIEKYEKYQRK